MKPVLDRLTDTVVNSLSSEAREFYDREFDLFREFTIFMKGPIGQ
jgi:phosphatidylinositol 4-kinase A